VPCARLSWPSGQLLSARKYTASYRMQSETADPVLPPVELYETCASSLILPNRSIIAITWRHPQNRNYITYSSHCRQKKTKPRLRVRRTDNVGEICACGFCDVWPDRQTNKQTDIQTAHNKQ